MKRALAIVLGIAIIVAVGSGCSSMKPEDFANQEPRLIVEEYFAGKTRAWGLFEDRFGSLRRQFVVDIEGTWDGSELVLEEDFRYDDGETERRVWRIVKTGEHSYEGRADDVVGVATGTAYGNALNWTYTLDLRAGDRTWRVAFDDWMFLQPDGVLINRARVSKWGLGVGEVTIAFSKMGDEISPMVPTPAPPDAEARP